MDPQGFNRSESDRFGSSALRARSSVQSIRAPLALRRRGKKIFPRARGNRALRLGAVFGGRRGLTRMAQTSACSAAHWRGRCFGPSGGSDFARRLGGGLSRKPAGWQGNARSRDWAAEARRGVGRIGLGEPSRRALRGADSDRRASPAACFVTRGGPPAASRPARPSREAGELYIKRTL